MRLPDRRILLALLMALACALLLAACGGDSGSDDSGGDSKKAAKDDNSKDDESKDEDEGSDDEDSKDDEEPKDEDEGPDDEGQGNSSSSEQEEYEREVQEIVAKVEGSIDGLDTGAAPTAAQFTQAATALDGAAAELDALDPPSEVDDLHEEFVTTVRDAATKLTAAGPVLAAATKDPQNADMAKLTQITTDFEAIGTKMEAVKTGYDEQGYDLGLDE